MPERFPLQKKAVEAEAGSFHPRGAKKPAGELRHAIEPLHHDFRKEIRERPEVVVVERPLVNGLLIERHEPCHLLPDTAQPGRTAEGLGEGGTASGAQQMAYSAVDATEIPGQMMQDRLPENEIERPGRKLGLEIERRPHAGVPCESVYAHARASLFDLSRRDLDRRHLRPLLGQNNGPDPVARSEVQDPYAPQGSFRIVSFEAVPPQIDERAVGVSRVERPSQGRASVARKGPFRRAK